MLTAQISTDLKEAMKNQTFVVAIYFKSVLDFRSERAHLCVIENSLRFQVLFTFELMDMADFEGRGGEVVKIVL